MSAASCICVAVVTCMAAVSGNAVHTAHACPNNSGALLLAHMTAFSWAHCHAFTGVAALSRLLYRVTLRPGCNAPAVPVHHAR